MKLIENLNLDNRTDTMIKESGHDHLIIKNCVINLYETDPTSGVGLVGIDVRKCGLVELINVSVIAHDLKRKYAYGMRSGYSNQPAEGNKKVLMSACSFSGFGPIDSTYKTNRDCVSAEVGCDDFWMKYCAFDGATDGCVDMKVKRFYASECLFKNSYRLVRVGPECEAVLSGCSLDTTAEHVWMYDGRSKLSLFENEFAQPFKHSYENAPGVITYPTVNPLIDPWFKDEVTPPATTIDFSELIKAQEAKLIAEAAFLNALKKLNSSQV